MNSALLGSEGHDVIVARPGNAGCRRTQASRPAPPTETPAAVADVLRRQIGLIAADIQAVIEPVKAPRVARKLRRTLEFVPWALANIQQLEWMAEQPANGNRDAVVSHDPVLIEQSTVQVRQDDLFIDVRTWPAGAVDLTATLAPSDTMAELRVALPRLSRDAALALAQALIWAAHAEEGGPGDD